MLPMFLDVIQCFRYSLNQTYVFYFRGFFTGMDTYSVSECFLILPVIRTITIVLDLFLYNRDLTQYLKEKSFELITYESKCK
jgi:hypothetical protein